MRAQCVLAIAATLITAHDQQTDSRRAERTPSGTSRDIGMLDVNGDGIVSPVDALVSIHRWNRHPLHDTLSGGDERFDVNGDGRHTTEDIFAVIEAINASAGAQTNERLLPRVHQEVSSELPATRLP